MPAKTNLDLAPISAVNDPYWPPMNAQARDELRAEMIDFACWVTDEDPDDEDFIAAIEFSFACLARIYQCSSRAIREHYASEIGRLGEIEYFYRFRPELNLKTAFSK